MLTASILGQFLPSVPLSQNLSVFGNMPSYHHSNLARCFSGVSACLLCQSASLRSICAQFKFFQVNRPYHFADYRFFTCLMLQLLTL